MYPVDKPKKRVWLWLMCGFAAVVLIAAGAVAVLFGWNRFTLSLIPQGEMDMTLDYGETFLDPGIKVEFSGTRFFNEGLPVDAALSREGTVDTQRTGTYTLIYRANYLWFHARAERVIHIVDRRAPELTLEGPAEKYIRPDQVYEEPGYSAWDDYDGDLTDRVQTREEEDGIHYWVEDQAGNRTEQTRLVHYDDTVPPEITLTGESSMEIYTATPYEEPGYTGWDNCDGDITELVTVEGTVNPYHSGEYTLTYTLTDSFGNTTQVERKVTVVPKAQPERVNPEGKVIYLTFDDGPGPYTQQLLDVLEQYNVKATFFVVCNKYADIIGEIAAGGHSVGIHSATHDYRTIYASEEAYFQDLNQVQTLILEKTGEETSLLRFPGGSSNTVSRFNRGIMSRLTQAVRDAGFQYFDWNVDSNDAGGARSSDEVFENVVEGIGGKRISIVLQHDIKGFSVEAVERIIIWGIENGYTFLPLDATSPGCHHGVNN